MFRAFLFVLFLAFSGFAEAQATATDSARAVVMRLMDAIHTSDGQGVVNCFADSAFMQTVIRSSNGAASARYDSYVNFARLVSGAPAGTAEQKLAIDMVKANGPLATVWATYRFFYKGVNTHCGAVSFELVRVNNLQWKIQYMIDTRFAGACK